ncbi:sigma-70 family RNA polymerase sigma factor [Vicingaceae bacterium]|nr:sigma-70 family RNA polymerase sigma factor [Vicingaceae bacterium]MDB4062351.1 sigma-70 family RNA polymerase sigma factor [Vicingaceae bacterium]
MEVNKNFSKKANEDVELVNAAKSGDQSAYTAIMVRYREPIYYLVLKMIRNESDAEDISIEAFEKAFKKAFKKLDQYIPEYAFSTWLYGIATNQCIDFIRKKKLKTTLIDNVIDDGESGGTKIQIRGTSKDPEETYIKQEKIELMREYVYKLEEPYKTLVTLRYFKEWSYEEIMIELEVPLGTVKAQLFRSRALLSNLMRKSKKSI